VNGTQRPIPQVIFPDLRGLVDVAGPQRRLRVFADTPEAANGMVGRIVGLEGALKMLEGLLIPSITEREECSQLDVSSMALAPSGELGPQLRAGGTRHAGLLGWRRSSTARSWRLPPTKPGVCPGKAAASSAADAARLQLPV
jgi:hypothetical protein